jgi:UDP-N-acetylglucosamine 3-dehydrogenase
MKKLNCAVIGCGRIGCGFDDNQSNLIKTHAGAYFKNTQTNLVALCDIDTKKLKKYAKKYNISKTYTNTSELFKNENLDCVSICTLVSTHLKIVKEAANSGVKAIFLEKPISNSINDAKKIIEICKKNKISLQIDHQRRFHPIYSKIKKILDEKKIGEIQFINVYYGAGIANTGSHMFDLLRMLFGEIKYVKSEYTTNKSANYKDPNLDIRIKFFNSITCRINSLDYSNYAKFEIEVYGMKGVLKMDLIKNEMKLSKISNKSNVYKMLQKEIIITEKIDETPIQRGLKDLINSMRLNKKTLSNGNEGLKSLEVIIASIKSLKDKKEIKLPLSNNHFKIDSK